MSLKNHENPSPYDFKKQQPLSHKRQLTLAYICHQFANKASKTLSTCFQNPINISITSLEQTTLFKYVSWLNFPTNLAILEMTPLTGHAILEINPTISTPAINSIIGESDKTRTFSHPMTHLELAINRKFITILLKDLEEVWSPFLELKLAIKEIHRTLPQTLFALIPKSEPYLLARFEVSWKHIKEFMTLALPLAPLDQIDPPLENFGERVPSYIHHLIQIDSPTPYLDLKKIDIELTARLGRIQISSLDLKKIKTGDILLLNQKAYHPIEMIIGKKVSFMGNPGITDSHKGVTISPPQPFD